jgi:hypothetical protein
MKSYSMSMAAHLDMIVTGEGQCEGHGGYGYKQYVRRKARHKGKPLAEGIR